MRVWQYSGHSFPHEGVTFALNCGVPGHYIKLQGDWLSNTYERYLDTSLQYKIIAVNMMSKSITQWFSHHFFQGIWGVSHTVLGIEDPVTPPPNWVGVYLSQLNTTAEIPRHIRHV